MRDKKVIKNNLNENNIKQSTPSVGIHIKNIDEDIDLISDLELDLNSDTNSDTNSNRNSNSSSNSDSDGSIEEDDIEKLESIWLGVLIQGEYVIVKYISRGTFSRVWLSYHIKSQTFYILKIYLEDCEDEFDYEVSIYDKMKDISLKRNLKMITTTSYKNLPIIILPYLGLSLDELLDYKENISYTEFKYLCKEILLGIQELHKLNIIHNDIKIDNILTNHYSKESIKFCEFVKNIHIQKIYDTCYNIYKPENFHQLNKDKRKKLKKKIKPKINKLFSNKILNLILEYQENEENYSELASNIDLEDIEFIEDMNMKDNSNNLQHVDLNNMSGSLNNNNNNRESDNENPLQNKDDCKNYVTKKEEKELLKIKCEDLKEIQINTNGVLSQDNIENNKSEHCSAANNLINIIKTKIKIIDYTNSETINNINNEEEYQIRAFRSPENIMGDNYSFKSEIWALGCLFWYILTKDYLFEPELIGSSINRDYNQIKLMENYLGNISKKIKLNCNKTFELFQNKNIIHENKNNFLEKENILNLLKNNLLDSNQNFTLNQINNIFGFFNCIFVYEPKDRFSIQQCLNHPFLLS